MTIFTAPDGSKFNIPDDPTKRSLFADAIKEVYGQDINETTVLIINYQNKFLPEDEVNTIMDLLIEGSGQETIH